MSDVSAWSYETRSYLCRHCGHVTKGEVLGTHHYSERDERGTILPPTLKYSLVRCINCSDASLLLAMEVGDNIWGEETSLYPAIRERHSGGLPASIAGCFEEAEICYRVKAATAAAIMARRTLELLAAEQGLQKGNLAQRLQAMRDQQVIDARLYEWADELRLAGNQAAHDVHLGISLTDARDMLDLVEAIVDYVYVFQERYEAFKARRRTTVLTEEDNKAQTRP